MNWLPIVNRELRVAARKRSSFWLRVAAATTGLVIGGACLLLGTLNGATTSQMGSALFGILTWMCMVSGLAAGLFFTSDCLSEEKREGTLGLLFLTELRGFDVALGKLAATSLRGFYALLAVLPVMALTQLMGGVTGAQYWKSALALVDGLFFSLAAGMLVSAVSRDSQKAMAGTLLLLLLLVLGGIVADSAIAGVSSRAFAPLWSLASPAYVLGCAGAWGRSAFWQALLTTHGLAWAMLGLACLAVPHAWQERRRLERGGRRAWWYAWKYGGAARRRRLRARLLERWPITWLNCREGWQAWALWSVTLLAAGGFGWLLFKAKQREAWIFFSYLGGLLVLLLYLWAASQACRFLAEARRSGVLELLLATPVNEQQLIQGQWLALLRMFGLPLLLLVGLHMGAAALSQLSFLSIGARANAATTTVTTNAVGGSVTTTVAVSPSGVSVNNGTNTVSPASGLWPVSRVREVTLAAVAAGASGLCMVGNLVALCWFGMWMGLSSRSANLATLKTVLFVQIIPYLVVAFLTSVIVGVMMSRMFFLSGTAAPGTWFQWWPLLSTLFSTLLALGKDVGFSVWSRNKLLLCLREQSAQAELRPASPPPLPRPVVPPPPVILGAQ